MLRNIMMATGVAVGILGMSLTASEARAGGNVAFGISGKNFGLGFSSYNPNFYPPVRYPAPVVVRRPVVVQPVYAHYHVFYRDCAHSPWLLQGAYAGHGRAHQVAQSLRFQGFQARVSHH